MLKNLYSTGKTLSNNFSIGDGLASDKTITAFNAMANKPKLKYNQTLQRWQYTNDGTNYQNIRPDFLIDYTPFSLNQPASDSAEVKIVDVTVGSLEVAGFDDTTPEHLYGQFRLPDDACDDLIIELSGYCPTTHGTDEYIRYKLYYEKIDSSIPIQAVSNMVFSETESEDFLTAEDMGLESHSFEASLVSMGLAGGDFVRFKIEKMAPADLDVGHDPLVGDWNMLHLRIKTGRN